MITDILFGTAIIGLTLGLFKTNKDLLETTAVVGYIIEELQLLNKEEL